MASFSSPVFTMPGESPEKLPFVHSTFKPRSKFAKSFGGRRSYGTSGRPLHGIEHRATVVTKLPQITYNSRAHQETTMAFGAASQGLRKRYPGFLGRAKIKRKHSENDNNNNNSSNGNKLTDSSYGGRMYKYGSLPNLAMPRKNRSNYYDNNDSTNKLFLGNKARTYGQYFTYNVDNADDDSDILVGNLNDNLESLIFFDDETDGGGHQASSFDHNTKQQQQQQDYPLNGSNIESSKRFSSVQNLHGSFNKGNDNNDDENSSNGNEGKSESSKYVEAMSEELEKKIKDARGKSGMKRRSRRDNKSGDHSQNNNVRRLGDVMTSERLSELLTPRKHEVPIIFNGDSS